MIKHIVEVTNPTLRKNSKNVVKLDKKVLSLIKDLKDTLRAQTDPEGVGLAAPQIGKNYRIFIMKPENVIKTVINPEIISVENLSVKEGKKNNKIMEGCLSLPHYYGPLKRSAKVKVKYLTEEGKETVEEFTDFEAQIILHEVDHLNGILFVDRLLEQKKPLYEYVEGEWEEVDIL